MTIIIVVGVVFLLVYFPILRCAVMHPFQTVFNALRDGVKYIVYKQWRNCPYGTINAFIGYFRGGKTLSGVHYIAKLYRRYNDLRVYDKFTKRWCTQKIVILSNVEFTTIPYIPLKNLKQMVEMGDFHKKYDEMNGTLTVTIVYVDEASTQLNSRAFKENFANPLVLGSMLQVGHYAMSFYYTTQRYLHVDCLLRQVTYNVIDCQKVWRYMKNYYYDGWEMENATNPTLLVPIRRDCWFVCDKDFWEYDTHACVETLVKSATTGDMLSSEEVLAVQGYETAGLGAITKPSKRLKKTRKKGA